PGTQAIPQVLICDQADKGGPQRLHLAGHNQPSPVAHRWGDTTALGYYHGNAASDGLGGGVAEVLAARRQHEDIRVRKSRVLISTESGPQQPHPAVQIETGSEALEVP